MKIKKPKLIQWDENNIDHIVAANVSRLLMGRPEEVYCAQTRITYVSGPKKGKKVPPRSLRAVTGAEFSPSLHLIAAIAAAERMEAYELLRRDFASITHWPAQPDSPAPVNKRWVMQRKPKVKK